jgi:hypothetical protein
MNRNRSTRGHRMLAGLVCITSSLLGVTIAVGLARPATDPGCPTESQSMWAAGSASSRETVAALDGEGVVMIDPGTGRRKVFTAPGGPGGLLRHISTAAGLGTVYVDDRRGPDTVVIATSDHVFKIREKGEVTHPTWSPSGQVAWSVGTSLRVWSPADRSVGTIPIPEAASSVFSPVFTAPDEIAAVVQEPVPGTNEDDSLDNLWRYDMDARTWTRVTSFEADAEHWSVIRTPVPAPDGTLRFVLIQGLSSMTDPPSFELWRYGDGAPLKIRDLPREMYLAAATDGGLTWNTPGGSAGEWRLVFEAADGTVSDLGCGSVAVDPVSEPDPDVTAEQGHPNVVTGQGSPDVAMIQRGLQEPPQGSSTPAPLALLVGDFDSRQGALATAQAMSERLGVGVAVSVIDHWGHPIAVRPGAWAAVALIPTAADPEAELARFRTLFPEYAGSSWIVAL